MGRPRMHGANTAARLLDAAERILEQRPAESLSIRALAAETSTSTRAVYSTFGSMDALYAALAGRAFAHLESDVRALPATADPASDLVAAGLAFRRLVTEHPALLRLAFRDRDEPAETVWPALRSVQRSSLAALNERVERVLPAGTDAATVRAQTLAFHALCEGLATLQLRGLPVHDAWRGALTTLVRGICAPASA